VSESIETSSESVYFAEARQPVAGLGQQRLRLTEGLEEQEEGEAEEEEEEVEEEAGQEEEEEEQTHLARSSK
jgi:hypothetical protein